MSARRLLGIATTALLLTACAAGADTQPAQNTPAVATPNGGGTLHLPAATPYTLDIPLRAPTGFEDTVEISVSTDTPCLLKADIKNETLGFNFDSDVIPPDALDLLRDFVAELLAQNPHQLNSIDLTGHASSEGEETYNTKLSQRRADAVAAALTAIPELTSVPINSEGRGIEEPIADDNTEEGRQENRRVELSFYFTDCT